MMIVPEAANMPPTPVAMNLLVNRDAAPFNDPDIRRAMQLTIDRKSFLDMIDALTRTRPPPSASGACRAADP